MDNVDVTSKQPDVVVVLLYDVVAIHKHDGEDAHPDTTNIR